MSYGSSDIVVSLRNAIPYVNKLRGKTFLLLFTAEMIKSDYFDRILRDIQLLHSLDIKLIIIYGCTIPITMNHALKEHKNSFLSLPITVMNDDEFTLIKQQTGQLQLDIMAKLSMNLTTTTNHYLNVISGNFVTAQPYGIHQGIDYHHHGHIRRVNTQLLQHHLHNKAIILIGPIIASVTGENFYLNIEEIAIKLAIELKVEKIIGFSKQQGIFDQAKQLISEILPIQIEQRFAQPHTHFLHNDLSDLHFLKIANQVCRNQVTRCHLISYLLDGSLLKELFSREGIGTQIVTERTEKIRTATISDIVGILALIRPLEEKGTLIYRSKEQLELEIEQFTVIEFENSIIGCVALHPFLSEKTGEMACLVVHPRYQKSSRGELLLNHIRKKAKEIGLNNLFVLTTQSLHWFQERGFSLIELESLPIQKQKLYSYQRRSKILSTDLT